MRRIGRALALMLLARACGCGGLVEIDATGEADTGSPCDAYECAPGTMTEIASGCWCACDSAIAIGIHSALPVTQQSIAEQRAAFEMWCASH